MKLEGKTAETLNQGKVLSNVQPKSVVIFTADTFSPCPPDIEKFIDEALRKRKPSLIQFATNSQPIV